MKNVNDTKTENARRIEANKKFEHTLSWKRKEAIRMARQIWEFIRDNIVPGYEGGEWDFYNFKHLAGEAQRRGLTTEYQELMNENKELTKLHWQLLNTGKSVAARFRNGNEVHTQTLAHMYSKHRMDPVWNWRKSQLIRKVWRNKIINHPELVNDYHPLHIVLTVPHDKKGFRGEKYFGSTLLYLFKEMRRKPFWKKYIYGGESGIEVKASKNGNGLHIHIHSFALMYKDKSLNDFRACLAEAWKEATGATQIWAETLYFYKKDESGQYQTREIEEPGDIQEDEAGMVTLSPKKRVVKVKAYVNTEIADVRKKDIPETDKQEEIINIYLRGMLECMKYHFKQDALYMNESEQYDLFLMNDVLTHTKRQRLYNRFGGFYNDPELNLQKKIEDAELKTEPDEDESELMSEAEETIINPFTLEEAIPVEYDLVVFRPENRRYNSSHSINPWKTYDNDDWIFRPFAPGTNVKEAVRLLINGTYSKGGT